MEMEEAAAAERDEVVVVDVGMVERKTADTPDTEENVFTPESFQLQKKKQAARKKRAANKENERRKAKRKRDKTKKARLKEDLEVHATCPICFDPWTNMGVHRVVSLKCGHLFGMSCAIKCLKARKQCPQCNEPANRRHLRPIFCSRIIAKDMSGQKYLGRRLDEERAARLRAEAEKQRVLLELQTLKREFDALQEKVKRLSATNSEESSRILPGDNFDEDISILSTSNIVESQLLSFELPDNDSNGKVLCASPRAEQLECPTATTRQSMTPRFKLANRVRVDGARVATLADSLDLAIISHAGVAKGTHGIAKVSLVDTRHKKVIALHSKAVRDVKLQPIDTSGSSQLVLTTALDARLQAVDIRADSSVLSYALPAASWACEWSRTSPFECFAGLVSGRVLLFDTRHTRRPIRSVDEGKRQPVHSLQHRAADQMTGTPAGLIVGKVGQIDWWLQGKESVLDSRVDISAAIASVRGTCTAVSALGTFVDASCRSGAGLLGLSALRGSETASAKCVLFRMAAPSAIEPASSCTHVRSFNGHQSRKVLSRAVVFRDDDRICVAAGDEAANRPIVWTWSDAFESESRSGVGADIHDGPMERLDSHDSPILDVKYRQGANGRAPILLSLSKGEMHIYSKRDRE